MGQDLEVEPGVTVGDWLMRELSTHYHIETEPWAGDTPWLTKARIWAWPERVTA